MPDKEVTNIVSSMGWVFMLIAAWGGLVRYLMDIKRTKAAWSWAGAVAQIIVSSFTGLIGGIVSVETGLPVNRNNKPGNIRWGDKWKGLVAEKQRSGQGRWPLYPCHVEKLSKDHGDGA